MNSYIDIGMANRMNGIKPTSLKLNQDKTQKLIFTGHTCTKRNYFSETIVVISICMLPGAFKNLMVRFPQF